ncbi:unnamed protein product [Chilo suppressalis]|uniref:Integrase catalytic domain-containing protein n=1 Tax=Chilo suppressalis TaxID=168631 RepID=A0ABN8EBR0_CHISP|nr:unnamed protein product [Chilo suppressalis]
MSLYSSADNLLRLSMALRGAAHEAVAVLLVTARDPTEVVQALDRRFGRPELIVIQETATIRALPRINNDSADLNKFACRVCNCVEVIKLLNQKPYLESPELYQCILSKLSPLLRNRWADFGYANYIHNSGITKLELLSRFLSREVDLQLQFGVITDSSISFKKVEKIHASSLNDIPVIAHEFKKSTNLSNNSEIVNKLCPYCGNNHTLSCCDIFNTLSINDRWQFVTDKKLCHKCLKKGSHNYKNCKMSKEVCKVKSCMFKHHRLLHDPTALVTHVSENDEDIEPGTSGASHSQIEKPSEVLHKDFSDIVAHNTSSFTAPQTSLRPLLKMIAVTVAGPLGTVDTYALLDDGSTATFIDADLASKIGAKGPVSKIKINCIGGLSKDTLVEYIDFNVKGRHSSVVHAVKNARCVTSLQLGRQTVCFDKISKFSHLTDIAPILCYENVQPKLIIGIDHWELAYPLAVKKGSKSEPVAIKTALGWVLFGCNSSRTKPVEFINHSLVSDLCNNENDNNLEELIKHQYSLDSIGITKRAPRSADDERAISILERTANRLPDGRFEVGLLWKSNNTVAPNSYALALSRFLGLEKKMMKDPAYAERYKQNIHDTLAKGYAEKCSQEPPLDSVCWYLPHFGVTNPNKPNKLRVVHDAAAKSNGVSLNNLLLTGPDLLQPLFDILLRFREGRVAMTADIKEMFPRFKIIEHDRDAQRFLWRDSPKDPLGVYRMSSMIFGAVSSPFTAMYMKNKNALEFKEEFPEAAHAIISDVYMDDYIGSVESADIAAELASDIVKIHARAGLEMRGWVSNDPTALKLLPRELVEERFKDKNICYSEYSSPFLSPPVRALGLIWQPITDTISFNTPAKNNDQASPDRLTKRKVLSLLMRVFDPLGILAPVVIRGRIMFQNVWRMNLNWDAVLPQPEVAAWNEWFKDLIITSQLQIPRCYNMQLIDPVAIELHLFADASEQAYTAVAYYRFLYPSGHIQLSLVSSRSRVAPLKPSSIPRLELQAALIAARLASTIVEGTRYKFTRRLFWCDSMNVLGWLRNDARCYKPFVAHRIGEIIELTNVCEWRWVPTHLNVADDATRLKRGALDKDSRWVKGPEFLLTSDWPIEPAIVRPILESKPTPKVYIHLTVEENCPVPLTADSSRFSSWTRLLRSTAQAHRFLFLLRIRALKKRGLCVDYSCRVSKSFFDFVPFPSTPTSRNQCDQSTLTADGLRFAEIHILRQSQIDSFPEDLRNIRNGQTSAPRSRLSKLPCSYDEDHLLRLSSRIVAAFGVSEEMKSPIMLDGNHHAVRLLVLHYHRKTAHANNETVINELRQLYWILSLRNTVRAVARACQSCRIRRASAFRPVMGNLPPARLAHHKRPFSFVGLDYFGPITISIGRRREKRYVALYTCLTVRAIHLEIVHSLSTDAAIMSLRRFIARRGTPSEIYSDNGTAFIGANRQLKQLYGQAVSDYATSEIIRWKFIPPSAPFMGGAWERLIKSVKTALKISLGDRTPSDEVLSTLLCEVEAIVNSRPLTHVPTNPNDQEALTPLHFILGSSSGRPFPASLQPSDLCSRQGWRRTLAMADIFWQRWIKEYLPTLCPRRVPGNVPTLKVGDVVIIADGTLPRSSWPRGRISAVYPGKDGVIRVADVSTPSGILRRPLKKLIASNLKRKGTMCRIAHLLYHYVLSMSF